MTQSLILSFFLLFSPLICFNQHRILMDSNSLFHKCNFHLFPMRIIFANSCIMQISKIFLYVIYSVPFGKILQLFLSSHTLCKKELMTTFYCNHKLFNISFYIPICFYFFIYSCMISFITSFIAIVSAMIVNAIINGIAVSLSLPLTPS